MSRNSSVKKDWKSSGSKTYPSKSESSETIVPKLVFAPVSNFHKWKKQLLKRIKQDYGPIHDSIVTESYPNFLQEAMQLILTPPEEIFREIEAKSKSACRKSISARGHLSFLHSDDDSSSVDSIDSIPVKGPAPVKSEPREDVLGSSSPTVDSLLKMAEEITSLRKKRSSDKPRTFTDQQLRLIDNFIAGKQKMINDLELFFIKNLPSVCAFILSTLSVQAETKVRQHAKFDKAYGKDDVIKLMKIIQQCAVLTPLDVPNLCSQIRKTRDKLYQGNKPLDYFCELFNQHEKDLVELGRATPEDDLIVEFLNHLHPSYCSVITQWKMGGIMPSTLDAVQH